MDLALLVVLVVVGLLLAAHGAQKLFGLFGGPGLRAPRDTFDALRLQPGRLHAVIAGVGELVGGALPGLGLVTPVGAALAVVAAVSPRP